MFALFEILNVVNLNLIFDQILQRIYYLSSKFKEIKLFMLNEHGYFNDGLNFGINWENRALILNSLRRTIFNHLGFYLKFLLDIRSIFNNCKIFLWLSNALLIILSIIIVQLNYGFLNCIIESCWSTKHSFLRKMRLGRFYM